ncbi:hypothetical protein LQZ19_16915 [Treponema primitia]|uniref:hypothetical protein n=1 Tax=Treponema primitia TaxID=88058 RepID=UPI0039811C1F
MKKLLFVFSLFVLGLNIFAQDAALPRLAVAEFSTNISNGKIQADAITVRNLVESQMIGTGKYQMITRDEIDKLLKNQQIAVSSISSSENIRKLQLQNINYIVTGSLDAMDADYAITVKVLDVSTGQFSNSANDFMGSGSRDLYNGINTLMGKFTAGMTSSGDRVVQTGQNARTGSSGNYKVGDFGPAGGIVFYDKGVFSGGWRYLEAAPAELEFTAQWGWYNNGTYGPSVSGTSTAIGGGKRNTQLIIDALKSGGHTGKAAQLCLSLDYDGFKDWFLPSKDELNLMYTNLKAKGLGGFSSNWYLSSSEDGSYHAWIQSFSDGRQSNFSNKDNSSSVRAVRAF